jgi:hypothetical protein
VNTEKSDIAIRKSWTKALVLVHLAVLAALASAITWACAYGYNGYFVEDPSPYFGAFPDPWCEENYDVPNCGYYYCQNGCSQSYVQGCTWETTLGMYFYMIEYCLSEPC